MVSMWVNWLKPFALVSVFWASLLLCAPGLAWARPPEPFALGLIVKLKDNGPVVSPSLQANPARWSMQSTTRQHMRLMALAWRHGLTVTTIQRSAFGAYVLKGHQAEPLTQISLAVQRVKQDADVEWVIPNVLERRAAFTTPNDAYFDQQMWLANRGNQSRGLSNFPHAWDALSTTTPNKTVVAVLDSGVPSGHPELVNALLPGYDFVSDVENARDGGGLDGDAGDPGNWLTAEEKALNPTYYGGCSVRDSSWHGLAIAGMLAANTHNERGIASMLWQLPGPLLLPVRVSGTCGAEVNDIIEGMLWAAGIAYQGSPALNPSPARVLNLSFGGDGPCGADLAAGSPGWLYAQTIQALKRRGVLVVASAGNGDANEVGLAQPTRPANCPGVLAVTGLNVQGFKARYANLLPSGGTGLAAFAGEENGSTTNVDDLIVTLRNSSLRGPEAGEWIVRGVSGTSFAAPMVAGVAAMMLSVNPSLSVDQLLEGLTSTAFQHLSQGDAWVLGLRSDLPTCDGTDVSTRAQCYCTSATCGEGVLNAPEAIAYALATEGNLDIPSQETASFFKPERVQDVPAQSHSSGGGGALDLATLAFIATLLGLTVLAGGKR